LTCEEQPSTVNELLITEKGHLMNLNLEEKIKDFVRGQGVDVVGLAGPDRLDGPPSLDPTYTLKGAKSIVAMVMPSMTIWARNRLCLTMWINSKRTSACSA
jgi:hypothetical protein